MKFTRRGGHSEVRNSPLIFELGPLISGRHADQVGKFTVFNIGGNKVRLIAAVHYNRNKIYIRHVLTHCEYDAGKWKK